MKKDKLLKELRRIRDIPNGTNSCHQDHREMQSELDDLIDELTGKCRCCGK